MICLTPYFALELRAALSYRIGNTTGVSWLLIAEVAADGGEVVEFAIEEAPGDVEGVIPELGLKRDAKAAGEEFGSGGPDHSISSPKSGSRA